MLHVEQLLSIWVLDLLSDCGAMSIRSRTIGIKPWSLVDFSGKMGNFYSSARLNEAQIKQTYDSNSGAKEDIFGNDDLQ